MSGDKQGSLAVQLLIIVVVIVLSSIVVLLLVRAGILLPQATDEPILNTEFLPVGRGGELVVREFEFCEFVTDDYRCLSSKERFSLGDEVHFRFVVESSPFDGQLLLVENYRVKGPEGALLLDVEEKNNFYVSAASVQDTEDVMIKDFFIIGSDEKPGPYTLELVLENPLIGKTVTVTKTFALEEPYYLSGEYIRGLEND